MDIESTDPMETSKVKPKMGLNRKIAVNFVFLSQKSVIS